MQKKSLQCRVKRKRRTWINVESRIVVEKMALPQACPVKEIVTVIESFHSLLKSELFYSQEKQIHSTSTLKQLIHDYIEYYHTECIQETLNDLSPIEYKKQVA
ncbi:hypothetical protein BK742_17615 [Bacillus thuringiensis serovar pingluonsis]|uniref:Integrase catalytic domain-containing protein n=2 Tax=Bacillus TaxID=1386 RepID=A0A243BBK9_BACTU|nr:IS3 family transposase [Bacillus thuringiensis]OTY41965.1 hypothetical protein BK742_17615 [Bacillus thuringiensis serovar pingluonsis]